MTVPAILISCLILVGTATPSDATNRKREDSTRFATLYQKGKEYYKAGKFNSAVEAFSSVLDYKKSVRDTTGMLSGHAWLSICQEEVGNFEASIYHGENAYQLALSIKDYESAALSINNLGITYKTLGENTKALEKYQLGLTISSNLEDKTYDAAFYENIGILRSNQGAYVEALQAYTDALRIYEELNLTRYIAELNLNIGVIYKQNKEYQKAINFYKSALQAEEESKDTLGMQSAHENIGNAYLEWNKLDMAKHHLLFAYRLNASIERDCLRGTSSKLGHLYLLQKNIDSAQYYLDQEWVSVKRCNNGRILPSIAYLLGLAKIEQRRSSEALHYLTLALHKAEEIGQLVTVRDASLALYQMQKSAGNEGKALTYHEKYQQATDALFNQENTRKLAWLEANHKMERISDSLTFIRERGEHELNERIASQNRRFNFIVSGAVVLLMVLYMIYLYFKNKRELVYQFELNEERKRGFNAVINATEEERKRMAKELHDGVVQQIGSIKLIINSISNESMISGDEQLGKAGSLLDQTADEIRNLSHQMMPKALMEVGLISAMDEVIGQYLSATSLNVDFQHSGLRERYSTQIEVSIYRIFQELMNNIVKHAKADRVDVQLMENRNKLILMVEDDGVGLNHTKTNDHGIGLSNIRSRLTTIDGNLNFSSGENFGTVATIVIPL